MADANPISTPSEYEAPHPATVEVNTERLPVVYMKDGGIFASSRDVAAFFGKEHRSVLASIDNLLNQEPDLGLHHFMQTPYIEPATGQTYRMYEMDRDGFTLLGMGFTGARALKWKLAYIAAFNGMEAQLRAQVQAATIDLSDPAQLVPLLTAYAQRTQIAEAKVVEMTPKAEAFDRLDTAEGNLTLRPAAKTLGVMETKLSKWLELNGWAFRQNGRGPLQPYASKRLGGFLEMKLRHYDDPKTGEPKVDATMVITPKGMARLAEILPREV